MHIFKLLFVSAIIASACFADIINVPDDFETIQAGIDEAEDGDTVLVQPGEYLENIDFSGRNIVVGSLYLTTGNWEFVGATVIEQEEHDAVVTFVNEETEDAEICGFTITGGVDEGGVYCNGADPCITGCIITQNGGSGIYCVEGSPQVNGCILSENAPNNGAGVFIRGEAANVVITDCEFLSNRAGFIGGGLFVDRGAATLIRCNFYDNTGENPESYPGHAICAGNSSVTLINCTIGRQAIEYQFGRTNVINLIAARLEIVNCIIWSGWDSYITTSREGAPTQISVSYSDIEGGRGAIRDNNGDEIIWGEGNLNGDPLFVDAENGDHNLTVDSPGIDAGDPEADPDPDGTRVDMGAFYFSQSPLVHLSLDSLDFGPVSVGQGECTLSFFIANCGINDLLIEDIVSDDVNFTTDFEEGLSVEQGDSAEVTVTYAPAEQGLHSGRLTVISNDPDSPEDSVVVTGWAHLGMRFDTDGYAHAVDTDGDLVFLSDGEAGLGIYRNIGMGELNLESQLELEYPPALETDVFGHYAVVRVDVKHALIDVSDPTHPDVYRYYGDGGFRTTDFQVFGHYLGLTDEFNSDALLLQSQFFIHDFSDPEQFRYPINNGFNGWVGAGGSVVISGNRAFVTGSDGNGHYRFGVFIIDVSNPRETEPLGFIETESIPTDVAVSGDYVFLTSGGDTVSVYNVSNPDDPQAVSVIECESYVRGVRTYYEYLMLLKPQEGVTFYNMIDPEHPAELVTFSALNPTDIKVDNDVAYVTCGEAGVISFDISDYVSADLQPTLLPAAFSLLPPYPNPFNSSTTITYTLPMQSNVALQIYNTRGQMVDMLLDQEMPAGKHSVVWEASRLCTGVYLVSMKRREDDTEETQKLVLIR